MSLFSPQRRTRSWAAALLLTSVLAVACSDPGENAKDVALACGKQECPVGTMFHEKRNFSGSYDISGGYDPTTYKADGAFKTMGTGDCEYICQVMQPCPTTPATFPYITEKCFTCVVVLSDNTLGQPSCPQ